MKQEKEQKIAWVILFIALSLFFMGMTSCGSPKYGKEEISISSEFKWEYLAAKMGNDTVTVGLSNGGTLVVYPNPHGEVEIIAQHTRESIYLDRFYGAIFVHVYLREPNWTFEETANYVFNLVHKVQDDSNLTPQDSFYINSVAQN